MPVKGLTDQLLRMPRLGKIRLGDKGGTNGAPVNRPYFVVPPEVAEVYGETPTELPIVFLVDDEEVIASSYYRAYNASNGLVCKGDGDHATASLDVDTLRNGGGELSVDAWAHGATGGRPASKNIDVRRIACAGAGYDNNPPCPMFAAKKCSVRSFFQFAIYGVPGLGVYQMDTGSAINVSRMLGSMGMARTIMGGVSGVPMILSREQTEVAPDGTKKKIWTVNLKVDTKLSLTEMLKLRTGPLVNALLPPVDESEVYDTPEEELPVLPPSTTDWPAFIATLKAAGVTTEDVKRVVPIVNGSPTAGDFNRWLQANAGRTPQDLYSAILAARNPNACTSGGEHEPQYNEDTTLLHCSKCGTPLEEPGVDEPVTAGLGI